MEVRDPQSKVRSGIAKENKMRRKKGAVFATIQGREVVAQQLYFPHQDLSKFGYAHFENVPVD